MSDQGIFLQRFSEMSSKSAAAVISSYSSSFMLASRLLSPKIRQDIEALYGVVRIADEIVDGTAAAAGFQHHEVEATLDKYEADVLQSLSKKFHTDPVIHAFGNTARKCGFTPENIEAFFASMRRDLSKNVYDSQELDEYIYGSAEVIGLLCLDIFLQDREVADRASMEQGARKLGSAFQKVNFLRDVAEDSHDLGRVYLPAFDEEFKQTLLSDIRADLSEAEKVIPLLPFGARLGVRAATDLYGNLVERIERTPVEDLTSGRVRVPPMFKVGLATQALFREVRRK